MKQSIYVFLLLAVALTACQPAAPAAPTAEPTAAATETLLPTFTPEPTETPTPAPTATATPDAKATAAFKSTETASAVLAELDELLGADSGVAYQTGSLLWQQADPISITLNEPGGRFQDVKGVKLKNFILKSDVTWNTTGLIICGVLFRSEKDFSKGQQYVFQFLRLSGAPAWDIEFHEFGRYKSNVTGKVRFASALKLDNGAVNQFVLVAQENKFIVYINGVRQGQFVDDSKLAMDGGLAFLASEDSGKSTCKFENSWVWSLDQ